MGENAVTFWKTCLLHVLSVIFRICFFVLFYIYIYIYTSRFCRFTKLTHYTVYHFVAGVMLRAGVLTVYCTKVVNSHVQI